MWRNTISNFAVFILICWPSVAVAKRSGFEVQAECSQLPQEIKEEIGSYKGVANRIIREIVEGKYAGVTYQR